MPWVRARLRDSVVFARAREDGSLADENGTVEIRYKPNDGRMYRARAANLKRADAVVLPEDACGPAAAVEKAEKKAAEPGAKPARSGGSRGTVPRAPSVLPPEAVVIYADGACSGNPGPAGLGVIVIDGDDQIELSEYLGTGTNNIAELTALLRGLERVPDRDRMVFLHTDSQYSIGVLTKGWKAKANTELITRIRAELAKRSRVHIVYVPGHAGVPLNEHADQLARLAVSTRSTSEKKRKKPTSTARPGTSEVPG
jgi:ribonuclease HI